MANHTLDDARIRSRSQHDDDRDEALPTARSGRVATTRCIGPYQLDDRIGGGGMADVWAAWSPEPGPGTRVAIKRMRAELAQSPSYKIMFCDEARISALVSSHPNIVPLIDFGLFQQEPFMVFEYVDGVSVSRLLRLSWVRKKEMPLGVALYLARQVLSALDFVHSAVDERGMPLHIVHRDVSPENILVARSGEVKLTDFGIVSARGSSRNTSSGSLKGKLGYMSPEQIAGSDLDARSDLFSLGIVLAEMLTHAPLFRGLSELELLTRMYHADFRAIEASELSVGVRELLHVALQPQCGSRFQSARSFQEALEDAAARSGIVFSARLLEDWFSELGILPPQSGTFRVLEPAPRDNSGLLGKIARARETFAGNQAANCNSGETPRSPMHPVVAAAGPQPILRVPSADNASTRKVVDPVLHEVQGEHSRLGFEAPAFQFGSPPLAATFCHPLRRAELPTMLAALVLERRTGLLRVCDDMREKRLYFADGNLCFVSSTDASELLGRRLVALGLLRFNEVERALLRAGAERCRLGEALVARGVLPAHVVLRALIAQLEARFLELGNWHEGTLEFFEGQAPGVTSVRLQKTSIELVFDLVRQTYSLAELRKMMLARARQGVRRVTSAERLAERLPFTEAERRAIAASELDGSLNALVAGLAARENLSPADTYRGLFLALMTGLLVSDTDSAM